MLTIITISFNNSDGLRKTLESISLQECDEVFEHIIIDGASTDNSHKIIKKYVMQNNHVKFLSEKDNGIYNAMNKGLALSRQNFVAFLNAGDLLADKTSLQNIFLRLSSKRSVDLLYSNLVLVNHTGVITRKWDSGRFRRWKLYIGWMPPHPMTTIRRDLLMELDGFNEYFRISADYDLMLRALIQPGIKVDYLNAVIVKMEAGGVSNGSLSSILYSNFEVMKSWIGIVGFAAPYWIFVTKPLSKIFQLFKDFNK
ncbi:glycosyltransferase [Amylibacter sp.]|nr:glycosyltransferase [Amylibacter sp.]